MHTTTGPHIGHAYVPGLGVGEVFATEKPGFLTVQITRTGYRYFVARSRVQFRR